MRNLGSLSSKAAFLPWRCLFSTVLRTTDSLSQYHHHPKCVCTKHLKPTKLQQCSHPLTHQSGTRLLCQQLWRMEDEIKMPLWLDSGMHDVEICFGTGHANIKPALAQLYTKWKGITENTTERLTGTIFSTTVDPQDFKTSWVPDAYFISLSEGIRWWFITSHTRASKLCPCCKSDTLNHLIFTLSLECFNQNTLQWRMSWKPQRKSANQPLC